MDDIPFLPDVTPWEDGKASGQRSAVSDQQGERSPCDIGMPPSRYPLARIRALADKAVAALAPFCERIEIAGSLRRGRPVVGDIDLVILPKDRAAIRKRLIPACHLIADGTQNLIVDFPVPSLQSSVSSLQSAVPRLQLDIFFAHGGTSDFFTHEPSNWGTLLLCRTGSKEFNIWFAQQATAAGYHWNPYRGLMADGKVIASATEADLFASLRLGVINPEDRER